MEETIRMVEEQKTGCIQKGCTQNKKGAHKKEAVAEDVSQVVINDELTDQQQLFVCINPGCLIIRKLT